MEIQGLLFVKDAVQAIAILAIAAGVLIALSDIIDAQVSLPDSPIRKALKTIFVTLGQTPWPEIFRLTAQNLVRLSDGYISYWFGLSKNNYLPVGLFILLLFFAVPMALLINYLQGGAPWLSTFFISIALVFAGLIFCGENKHLKFINGGLAVYLFGALFIALPGYIFTVVNGHLLLLPTGHAMIGSILAVPALYFICYAVLLVAQSYRDMDSSTKVQATGGHVACLFLAVIPLNYLFTFAAFMAGHLAAAAHPSEQNWSLLLTSLFFSSLAVATTIRFFRSGKIAVSFIAAVIVGTLCSYLMLYVDFLYNDIAQPAGGAYNVLWGRVPSGEVYALNPQFWVMHLPFVPTLLFLTLVVANLIAKCLIALAQIFACGRFCQERPFMMAGALLISNGCILIIATLAFSN